jgi:hypothetical protein
MPCAFGRDGQGTIGKQIPSETGVTCRVGMKWNGTAVKTLKICAIEWKRAKEKASKEGRGRGWRLDIGYGVELYWGAKGWDEELQ